MSNPWDPFPFPLVGDEDDAILYEYMGRCLDRWECVEFELARTYSLFAGARDWSKVQEYGAAKIFRDRMIALSLLAETYFRRSPSQAMEGGFNRIAVYSKGFADRRNEVAHGLVLDVQRLPFFRHHMKLAPANTPQHLIVPPYYLLRKHDAAGLPGFGYSSVQLGELQKRLFILSDMIKHFNERL